MITERDKKIMTRLDENRVMSRWAIQRWLFDNYTTANNAQWKANERLRKLVKLSRINRLRWPERNNNYVYFMGAKLDNWQQYAWVNEIASLLKDSIAKYEHEYTCGCLRADGLFLLKSGKKLFVEIDSSNNPFDKPEKYSALFRSDVWERLWPSFPRIVVVTYRPEKVRKLIEKNSLPELKWHVLTFDNVDDVKGVIV